MENQNHNSYLKNVVRWIAVIPATLIIVTIGGKIIETILLIQNPNGNWPQVVQSIIAPAIYWSLAVYVGAIVAPKKRAIVAMALSFLVVTINSWAILFYFTTEDIFTWLDLVGIFFSTVSVGYITYKFFNEGDDFNLFDIFR